MEKRRYGAGGWFVLNPSRHGQRSTALDAGIVGGLFGGAWSSLTKVEARIRTVQPFVFRTPGFRARTPLKW
jgi:hypothetical protein